MHSNGMTILFATSIAGLGGGETSLLNLMHFLRDAGHRPVLVCPEGPLADRAKTLGFDCEIISSYPLRLWAKFIPTFSIKTMITAARLIKRYQVDVIHIESLDALYYFGIVARLFRIPLAATYHGFWEFNSPISRLAAKLLCTRVYAVSNSTINKLQDRNPQLISKTKVIPLSLDQKFMDYKLNKKETRAQLGFSEDELIGLQVARFQLIKGQMHLLDAVEAYLLKGYSPIPQFYLIGDILDPEDQESMAYKQQVLDRINSSELKNYVHCLGWRSDILQLLDASDMMIVPSEYESFSMVTIEAMILGKFVIATDQGGPSEILENGQTGLLVPVNSPQAMAEAIHTAAQIGEFYETVTRNARTVAAQKYDPQTRGNTLIAEYLELTGGRPQ